MKKFANIDLSACPKYFDEKLTSKTDRPCFPTFKNLCESCPSISEILSEMKSALSFATSSKETRPSSVVIVLVVPLGIFSINGKKIVADAVTIPRFWSLVSNTLVCTKGDRCLCVSPFCQAPFASFSKAMQFSS